MIEIFTRRCCFSGKSYLRLFPRRNKKVKKIFPFVIIMLNWLNEKIFSLPKRKLIDCQIMYDFTDQEYIVTFWCYDDGSTFVEII